MELEQGKWYEVSYDDGTELRGMFVKRERGFIEFKLGDGSRLLCRTGSVSVKPPPANRCRDNIGLESRPGEA